MTVRVRFFASLRERLNAAELDIELAPGATVMEAWRLAVGEAELPANLLVAVNQEYADLNSAVCDGDEVAFFPPVTGG